LRGKIAALASVACAQLQKKALVFFPLKFASPLFFLGAKTSF